LTKLKNPLIRERASDLSRQKNRIRIVIRTPDVNMDKIKGLSRKVVIGNKK